MVDETTQWEELKVTGDQLVATIRRLVHEGNVRRIIVKNEQDQTLLEIPLTVGVVGAILLPVWAALGAVAALVTGFTIVVEKVEPVDDSQDEHLAHAT